jgi:hypothetical protein
MYRQEVRMRLSKSPKTPTPGKRLTRDEAAAYLRDRWSLPVTIGMLQQYAYKGTGPAYARVFKFVRYLPADLDAWAAARLARTSPKSAELLGRERTA